MKSVPRIKLWTIVLLCFVTTISFFLIFGHLKDLTQFNFMESQSAFESASASTWGLLPCSPLTGAEWGLLLFCIFGTVLFLKRIALLGGRAWWV
ncbi:MAG: hypothetical protein QM749_18050 [Aquabacterium sp.]